MKIIILIVFFSFSCTGKLEFNNLFEVTPGLFLHYLWLQEDRTPPEVNYTTPYNYETNISRNRSFLAVYDEPLLSTSVKENTLKLYDASGNEVQGTVSISENTLTFTPAEYYTANTQYTIQFQNLVEDLSGNAQINPTEKTIFFTTNNDIDTEAPSLKSSSPVEDSTDAVLNTSIQLVFNEDLSPESVDNETVILQQGDTILQTQLEFLGNVVQLKPSTEFNSFTTYTVTIKSTIQDLSGNNFGTDKVFQFTTLDTSDRTAPTIETIVPANNSTEISNNSFITSNFSEAIDMTSVNSKSFYIEEIDDNGNATKVSGNITGEAKTILFRVDESFLSETKHRVTLLGTIRDLAGNLLGENKVYTFTTGENTSAPPFSIGGIVSGLDGTLVLQNNSGDDLTLTTAGKFQFSYELSYNDSYSVTIKSSPSSQICSVTKGSGSAIADVDNISIDCSYRPGEEVQSFTDNGDGTITDNNTSLVWMKCSMSGVSGTPLSGDCSYTNAPGTTANDVGEYQYCNEDDNDCNGGVNDGTYGVFTGNASASTATAWKACNDANSIPFAGRTNWRVPTSVELLSIVDNSQENPAINQTFFPNTLSKHYRTSTAVFDDSTIASVIFFNYGWLVNIDLIPKDSSSTAGSFSVYVRCVSGP
ncbi:MAG: Ig-like domain-containing protein [Spirochaetota bacterium]